MEQQTQDLIVRLLAQMGGALGGQGSWQQAAGGVITGLQNARNYSKLLGQISGNLPQDGKMSIDNKGVTLKMPSGSFGQENMADAIQQPVSNFDTQGLAAALGGGGATAPTATNIGGVAKETKRPSLMDVFLNPSSSRLDISGANLVGLTPETITSALQLGQGAEALDVSKIRTALDLENQPVDQLYKLAQAQHLMQGESLDQPYPVMVPGVGQVTNRQWMELPQVHRSYALYVNAAKELGTDAKIMSFDDWNRLQPTDHTRMLEILGVRKDLYETEVALKKAGATNINIGEKVETKAALDAIETEGYFKSPKFPEDVAKNRETTQYKQEVLNAMNSKNPDKKAREAENRTKAEKAKIESDIKFIQRKIAADAKTFTARWADKEKTTIAWDVEWKNGRKSTVTYKIR